MPSIKYIRIVAALGMGVMMFLCTSNIVWAITLSELQQKGIANRKIIEKYRLAVQQVEESLIISRSPFWPSLDIRYSANALDEDSTTENSKNSELVGSLSYNLFSGFKDRYQTIASDQLKTSKEFQLQDIIQHIKFQVAIRYLDAFKAKNQLTVSSSEVALLRKRYRDAENRYDVGLIRRNELLKLQVQLDDSIQKMKTAEAALQKSIHYLEFETESKLIENDLLFTEFSTLPEVRDLEYYRSLLGTNRSEIKALEALQSSQSYQASSLKSVYYPSVDVSANYTKYGDDFLFGLEEEEEDEIRLTLDVTMNLFTGFKNKAQINRAKLEERLTADDLHELKKRLETELKNALMDLDVARNNLEVAESSVNQAEENLRITDVAFKEGVETATDVLDAVLNLSRAKFNAIHSRSEVFAEYYQLMRLVEEL
jgi:outer membrane protein